ncbi:hypothetical protein ACIPSE_45415 [Streptomyces sp. NPDC090106]|uniref:hypothetical protein n=1 Tax=Streptomyces sp. NPDC090106 TaxID=3365946 RepID=UPI003830DAB9
MTDTVIPPAVGADSPLAHLFDMVREMSVQGEEEQREDAETAALDHIWCVYPDTLGRFVHEEDWTGKATVAGAGLEPCAVAYLDGGLWLHHCGSGGHEYRVLTLIAPCTCGNGYIDTVVGGETDLLQLLAELQPTGGRFPHSDRADCGSQKRLRAWHETPPQY